MVTTQSMHSVDDFIPEEGLDASFLDDSKDVGTTKTHEVESSRLLQNTKFFIIFLQGHISSGDTSIQKPL